METITVRLDDTLKNNFASTCNELSIEIKSDFAEMSQNSEFPR